MQLLIATRNPHKLAEIRVLLGVPTLELIGIADREGLPDVVEDGDSFQANAVKKAVTLALASGLWTLADDSGLEVEALQGAPGVRSARYAGEPANDAANNAKLLRALEQVEHRAARFYCVIALAHPNGRAQIVEGACPGRILRAARGARGFGYDPLFVPNGFASTFAEMDPATKNDISHRARALRLARARWGDIFRLDLRAWPPRRPADAGRCSL